MIVNETQLQKLRDENTRDVPLPDGTTVPVCLPGELWEEVQFLEVVDEIPMREMSAFALEEMELQNIDFTSAFRCIVVHLAARWR